MLYLPSTGEKDVNIGFIIYSFYLKFKLTLLV